jgi:hypothetical protein
MSDYTQITDFSAKDALTTGDPEKIILGADFDGEFSALDTAIASKYDSNDIASEAQAEAGVLDTVLMTPLQTRNVLQDNAGMAFDIQQLADPNVDTLLGWDDSAGAVIGFTLGDGLEFSGTTVRLEHLGMGDLEDPNDDRIMFWDDSAGATAWLDIGAGLDVTGTTLSLPASVAGNGLALSAGVLSVNVGNGISIAADTLGLTDVTASAGQPVNISAGTFTFNMGSLAELTAANMDQAADAFLVSDAGTLKLQPYDEAGVKILTVGTTSDTLGQTDMNCFIEYTAGTAVTVTLNSSVGDVGNIIIIKQSGAGQVTIAGTATIESAGSLLSTRVQHSVIVLTCIAANTWALYGDRA